VQQRSLCHTLNDKGKSFVHLRRHTYVGMIIPYVLLSVLRYVRTLRTHSYDKPMHDACVRLVRNVSLAGERVYVKEIEREKKNNPRPNGGQRLPY
jgi:hypothetical protein